MDKCNEYHVEDACRCKDCADTRVNNIKLDTSLIDLANRMKEPIEEGYQGTVQRNVNASRSITKATIEDARDLIEEASPLIRRSKEETIKYLQAEIVKTCAEIKTLNEGLNRAEKEILSRGENFNRVKAENEKLKEEGLLDD